MISRRDQPTCAARCCAAASPDTAALTGEHPSVVAQHDGEIVLLSLRPSFLWVLRYWVPAILAHWALVLARALTASAFRPAADPFIIAITAALLAVLVAITMNWFRRRYLLTDRRVLVVRGVVNRECDEMPLTAVRRITLAELRTMVLSSRGNAGTLEFVDHKDKTMIRWDLVPDPSHVRATACDAIKRYARSDFEG
jgi:hypothetical protein